MLNLKCLALLVCLLAINQVSFSQLGFSHELGVIAGPVQFRSDFGGRFEEQTNMGNSGIGIGIIHYINFAYSADCNCYTTETYFNDHFKLRSEVSWNKTDLDHHGFWVQADKVSINADKLRAHSGVAENFDIGMQLEYFPLSIRSFQAFAYRIAPFVSLGVHYTSSSPQAMTAYGDGNIYNPNNIYSFWYSDDSYLPPIPSGQQREYPINLDQRNNWSLVTSVGIRYKLTKLSDLMLDLRWQYYFSDWIDGFNHEFDNYNKYNDWLVWLNFGYILYL
ncbi:THC0290_0291 family protein [Confluentibacter flavum]|uniref:Glutamate dehydrogenase n=1 Tax=Confluentibacter flavum TaxID=1909700 RepID=A0A2N3HLP1_9FLAO|nr:glutamate dehydrogenase [Confluentibacter flavum]PKQ45875.1 glutamate dehydrogenase [Confluentibacter flavum]